MTVFYPQPSVFNRLGGKTAVKRPATSTSVETDPDEPPLEYAGVLKSSPTPVKKTKVTITNNKKYASLGKITISNKTVTSATGKIMEKTVTTKKLLVAKKPGTVGQTWWFVHCNNTSQKWVFEENENYQVHVHVYLWNSRLEERLSLIMSAVKIEKNALFIHCIFITEIST